MSIVFRQGQVANPTKSIKVKGNIDDIFNKLSLIPQVCEEKRSRIGIGDAVGKYGVIVNKQYTIKNIDDFAKIIIFKCPELLNLGSEAIILLN